MEKKLNAILFQCDGMHCIRNKHYLRIAGSTDCIYALRRFYRKAVTHHFSCENRILNLCDIHDFPLDRCREHKLFTSKTKHQCSPFPSAE